MADEKKESADGESSVSGSGETKPPTIKPPTIKPPTIKPPTIKPPIGKGKPFNSKPFDPEENAKDIVVEAEIQSSKSYHEIVSEIVSTAKGQLDASNKEKTDIRNKFLLVFIGLLALQFLSVVIFITLNAIKLIGFTISDSLMQLYVCSVFIETLGEVGIMIKFAFDSKDEVKIIELLTAVVNNYQKFHGKDRRKGDNKSDSNS